MAFMVQQRLETAGKTNEIMARFRPIAPKPPPPPPLSAFGSSSRARKRGRLEEYSNLPVSWPVGAGVGSRSDGSKGKKGQLIPSNGSHPLPGVPTCDEQFVSLSLAVPDASPSPEAQRVIRPRPARPLHTTICIDSSNIVGPKSLAVMAMSNKTAKEVEAQVEQDTFPIIVSGCQNRVFLVNDAYKAIVGQPVCLWLDSLPGTGKSKRINGEVVLKVQTFSPSSRLPNDGGAFSWELDGAIASLTVPCAVERLMGNAGEYRSIWRFDSTRAAIVYCIA